MSSRGTTTTTNQTVLPQYVQDAQQNLATIANNITSKFVSSPEATIADFSPDQTTAFNWLRTMVGNRVGEPGPSIGAATAGPAASASTTPATTTPAFNYTSPTVSMDQNVGQVGGADIRALLNPYVSDVLDPTIALMRRELGKTQAGIGASDASAAAFGGSRGALRMSEADRAFGDQVALTTAQLMAQGYDRATATALANASQRQAAAANNANLANTANIFNAGQSNQAAQFNAAAANAASQYNAGAANTASQYNATAANDMARANALLSQSAANQQNTFMTDDQKRQLAWLQALLSAGGMEQAQAQRYYDEPFNMLKVLEAATPNQSGQTTISTAPNNAPSPLQTIGGVGLGLLGLGTGGGSSVFSKLLGL